LQAAHYNSKLFSLEEYVRSFLDLILEDKEILDLFDGICSNQESKDSVRKKLFEKLNSYYQYMQTKGVLQLHFHLPDGTSFLRMHKPNRYGDDLLGFRYTVKEVIEKNRPVVGFEIGKYFEGFRYVYPLIKNNQYLGSVEVSLSSKKFITNMNKYLDGHFLMILDKKYVDDVMAEDVVKKNFHLTCFSPNYYMNDALHHDEKGIKKIIKASKGEITRNLLLEKDFALHNNTHIFIFKELKNFLNEHIGYSIQIIEDNRPYQILIESLWKFILIILCFILALYFYKKSKKNEIYLEQFKEFVDKTTLVSKTDLKGKINYVNDKFVEISGYKRDELLGKPHNLVRNPATPKEVFREMWDTIKSGEIWKGIITNKRKDGSIYTVDAKIFPIFNEKNEIIEYIALRYDITELESYRKILEEKLDKTSESLENNIALVNQYQNAIESASAFMRISLDGTITYVNKTMLRISNLNPFEILDKSIIGLGFVKKEMYNEIRQTILKNKEWKGVIECRHPKKPNCYIDAVFSPIMQNGKLREIICISHDVTEIFDLYKEIEDTQKEVVFTMGAIGESRSQETGNHVKRVAEYSLLLAQLAGLSEKECQLLKQASPMHDIGKVGIPDSILNKPGKLDEHEWKIMKTHSKLGYNMLKHSQRDILKTAAVIAYEHHEKWDGSGYPRGLQGEDIHIYGRITAIVDVFDALGSDRCYKKAWELSQILELFAQEKGKAFDPNLVDLFLNNIEKFILIRDRYKDNMKS
jgi:PAS domain S-box-containing protein